MINLQDYNKESLTQTSTKLEEQVYLSPYQPLLEALLQESLKDLPTSSPYLAEHSNALEYDQYSERSQVIVSQLGEVNWQESFEAMLSFTKNRSSTSLDQILLLEHQPVFTQGIAGKAEHIIGNVGNIPVMQADRGGQVTYHGPGQLIVYFLLDFARKKKFYKLFEIDFYASNIVNAMENALISFFALFGVEAYSKKDAPGIYINQQKVSSLGLKVARQGTYHGIAINFDMDLSPFKMINPCGYQGLEMTNMVDHIKAENLPNFPLFKGNYSSLANQLQADLTANFHTTLRKFLEDYFLYYMTKSFAYQVVIKSPQAPLS